MIGLLIPFFGTLLGSACVFFMKHHVNDCVNRILLGFASGVMISASVWSLLIPSIDMSSHYNSLSFLPACIGLIIGITFLLLISKVTPNLYINKYLSKHFNEKSKNTIMLLLAITIHNIPEGLAIGVAFAGINKDNSISLATAVTLAIGIGIQNFPEGAIISLPLNSNGYSKKTSFLLGTLSGIIEPIAALTALLMSNLIRSALPFLLAFAAGAMIFVVVKELIPEASANDKSNCCVIGFTIGFLVIMILDVVLS